MASRLSRRSVRPAAPVPSARVRAEGEFTPYELALEVPPPRRTVTIQVLPEDKEVFDALQAWHLFRRGRRLTQWEVFTLLLADGLANAEGTFAEARPLSR